MAQDVLWRVKQFLRTTTHPGGGLHRSLWLLARPREWPDQPPPEVSGAPALAGRLLPSLLAEVPGEVIVVDNGDGRLPRRVLPKGARLYASLRMGGGR